MAELVGEDSLDLGRRVLVQQSVIQHDLLRPREAVEVAVVSGYSNAPVDPRIGVGRALAAVDHVEVLERELQLAGKLLDALADLTLGDGRELVEERLD